MRRVFEEFTFFLIAEIQHITYSHPKFILLRNDNMYLYNDHLFFMDRIDCLLSSGMFNDNCCSSIVLSSHLSVKGTYMHGIEIFDSIFCFLCLCLAFGGHLDWHIHWIYMYEIEIFIVMWQLWNDKGIGISYESYGHWKRQLWRRL